jgi:hypothetical protein
MSNQVGNRNRVSVTEVSKYFSRLLLGMGTELWLGMGYMLVGGVVVDNRRSREGEPSQAGFPRSLESDAQG